jgi:MFS family permease
MYQVESAKILLKRGAARERSGPRIRVGRTVVLLGLTSLFTDLSSEAVNAILPLYLVYSVGLSPLQFGALDGINNGAAGLVRVLGGGLGDRLRRHKEVAALGYGLSALTRPLFLVVGRSFALIGGLVFVDRLGKGIRTAPRDALISLSVPKERLGSAFGVHRALDTAGAMLGPLVAFAILRSAPDAYDAVFVVSFASAVIGVGIIVLLVPPDRRPAPHEQPELTLARAAELLRLPSFRRLSLVATALALATISDAFVYLRLQRSLSFDPRYLPLLFVGSACSYMALAVPFGALADRVGKRAVFLSGYAILAVVYVLLLTATSVELLLLILPLFGAYYAATDGVLAAAASAALPEYARGTGLSLLASCTSLGRFAASLAFGGVWVALGADAAVGVFTAVLLLALAFAAHVLRRSPDAA